MLPDDEGLMTAEAASHEASATMAAAAAAASSLATWLQPLQGSSGTASAAMRHLC